jgi:hypothetical protein
MTKNKKIVMKMHVQTIVENGHNNIEEGEHP